jgi:hypothetical protein
MYHFHHVYYLLIDDYLDLELFDDVLVHYDVFLVVLVMNVDVHVLLVQLEQYYFVLLVEVVVLHHHYYHHLVVFDVVVIG